jgi:hypothetical protein
VDKCGGVRFAVTASSGVCEISAWRAGPVIDGFHPINAVFRDIGAQDSAGFQMIAHPKIGLTRKMGDQGLARLPFLIHPDAAGLRRIDRPDIMDAAGGSVAKIGGSQR